MKTIASFGGFVRETWWLLIPMFIAIVVALYSYNAPPTVTIDSHWECTMAKPDGLGAKCLEYVFKGR
mgnify:CR=1 FL=1